MLELLATKHDDWVRIALSMTGNDWMMLKIWYRICTKTLQIGTRHRRHFLQRYCKQVFYLDCMYLSMYEGI